MPQFLGGLAISWLSVSFKLDHTFHAPGARLRHQLLHMSSYFTSSCHAIAEQRHRNESLDDHTYTMHYMIVYDIVDCCTGTYNKFFAADRIPRVFAQ